MQGTKLNKDIPINEVSGVHSGHIQTTQYSSEGEDKSIYTFCITIYCSGHLEFSHFTRVIYYITLQIYFGYHLICTCISA